MVSSGINVFIPVAILFVFGLLLVGGSLLIGSLIRPKNPTKLKEMAYECGEDPIGTAWSAFNVRFYVVGLIFIIFDVESALMFPVVTVFKKMNEIGRGGLLLIEVLLFLAVLIAGIAYCWRKGDLDWVKSFNIKNQDSDK
ncbi:MAG: NADH-quinone oxidoreductase subunit A [Halobacteriovoraceae bacterium]|nr:NADH-quinone oxidoreductase subunit A [Halobacteriovoraceae bacterium]